MVAADAASCFPAGAAVHVCIRPEDVQPESSGLPGTRLGATVRGLEYLGSIVRVELEAEGLPLTSELSDPAFRSLALAPGEPLTVVVPPARVLLFPRDDAA